jgi:hypothetical protein
MNAWDAVAQAMREAREANRACDQYARQMASLIRGRLRSCDTSDLAAIKKELRDYNIHTGKWKD